MNKSFLLISDLGTETPFMVLDLATAVADKVVWVASEPPDLVKSVIDSFGVEDKVDPICIQHCKEYPYVNVLNLNEISIGVSKKTERAKKFILLISIIPELVLIHGLDKTFLFLLNTMNKIKLQNGTIFGTMTHGAQTERDEIMISRLFSIFLRYKKKITERGWERNIILENRIKGLDEEIYPVNFNGEKFTFPPKLKEAILREIHESHS